jgi:hypothetical protein
MNSMQKMFSVVLLAFGLSIGVQARATTTEIVNCKAGAVVLNKVSDGMQFDYELTINSSDIYDTFKYAGAIQEGRNGVGFPFVSGLKKEDNYLYVGAHGRYEVKWTLQGEYGGMKLSACGQNYQCGLLADWFFSAGECQVNEK